ncbi:glucose dehydrogenase [FAD, quinone] [Bicyclus anynana]|uniref:Glucose dehydrogenase [FAD, quinone] n=1 Tax=Bicyclus anynana TaxID=110368 RepID=A0A6J1NDR9_BICAN|nr:glucose dehydrogenase [FAD, quinone] [Bicyclus anynana]
MSPLHVLQFFIFSVCIHLFSIFTYLVYYYDLFTSSDEILEEYDFIIVGSGTAGSLIAHRLSKDTNYTFVVLEAGGEGHTFHSIPAFGPLLHGSVFDWQFQTVPQENACLAMVNSQCKQTQGKMLGGSSKMNNMIHFRGNTSHYVDWFHGKFTKEYIEEHLNYIESNVYPLHNIQYHSQISDVVLNAAEEIGYKELNSQNNLGFAKSLLTQRNGKRWTTSDNFDTSKYVLTNVLVDKLIIEEDKCIGVQISYPKRVKLFAKKGVIVSAGAYNSPKLLQLSGIGPVDILNSVNVSVIKELPVGKNLQDHIGTGLDLVLFDTPQSVGMFDIMNLFHVYQYFVNGTGALTTPGCEVVGFVSTDNHTVPDVQFMVLPVGITADRGSHLRKTLGITDFVWDNYFSKLFDKHAATFFTLLLHPKSIGEVKIKSKDPNLPPKIDPKYLSHPNDVKTLVNGVKILIKLVETDAMKAIGGHLNEKHFPGCENYDIFSDLYLECYVKHLTLSSYHPVGTCSMGPRESKSSVVDTSFKVIGIEHLYVVDGSVLPTLPSGNINAAIAMMANIFFENTIKSRLSLNENLFCKNSVLDDLIFKVCPVR